MTISAGGIAFRNNHEGAVYSQQILKKRPIGGALNLREMKVLVDALKLWGPRGAAAIGCGIDSITVEKHNGNGSRCFKIRRIDGTETEISYLRVWNRKSSHKKWVIE